MIKRRISVVLFLEKNYNPDMSLEDAAALAIACINLKDEVKDEIKNVKMAKVCILQRPELGL